MPAKLLMNFTGLLILLIVAAFPVIAVVAPFFTLWYGRNREQVAERVTMVRMTVGELRENLEAAYQADEGTPPAEKPAPPPSTDAE
jgi:hypothetical protein